MGDVSQQPFFEGIKLFNSQNFFEAHEVLEDVWREARNPEKKFLQALIQISVALHHHSRNNHAGAKSLLARALRNLGPYPDRFGGIDLLLLRRSVANWSEALHERRAPPPHFRINLKHTGSR